MLGGVSGGLSAHTGIDVILFRVGFVVLTVAGGAGLLLYLALWLLLPDAHGTPGSLQKWLARNPGSTLRTAILAVAAVFVAAIIVDGAGADAGVIAILAVAALAYLWNRDRDGRRDAAELPADHPAPPVAGAVTATLPRPPRQRSALGRITISALLIVLGVIVLLDRQTDFDLSTSGYLAVALGIVGAGLLAGTFWGRSRGLIVLGIPLVILLAGASAFDVSLRNGVGDQYWQPQSAAAVEPSYRFGLGQAELDLSTVDFEDADITTSIRVSVGYVRILVPGDVDVRVTTDVRAGAVSLFDVDGEASSDPPRTVTDNGADGSGGGQLDLAVDLGLGFVEVTRVG